MNKERIALFIVDPQNDFHEGGALPVVGANDDAERLALFIRRYAQKIHGIYVSMDWHNNVHIAHPIWWSDENGNHPEPYSNITLEDVKSEKWVSTNFIMMDWSKFYVEELNRYGKTLTIWPPHCIAGTPGSNIVSSIRDAITYWEMKTLCEITVITKGDDPRTENYSVLRAEIPTPNKDTLLNTELITEIFGDYSYDRTLFAGQALNFCYAETLRDFVANIKPEKVKTISILTDTTSAVRNPFDANVDAFLKKKTDDFISEMTSKGVNFTTTEEVLSMVKYGD